MWRKILFEHWVVCTWIFKRLSLQKRTQHASVSEYEIKWAKRDFLVGYPELHIKSGELVLLRHLERYQSIERQIQRVIDSFRPTRVLEMGIGTGVNIIALALMNNDEHTTTYFHGIDLSPNGLAYAQHMIDELPVDIYMAITRLSREEIEKRKHLLKERVTFSRADMLDTKLESESFDFVYTHVAIEQLPRSYHHAFAEAFRMLRTGGYAFFMEEFAEAQTTLLRKINIWAQDYFHASIRELSNVGFTLAQYEPAEYQKYRLGVGCALVHKPKNEV